jgi:hypothetical protein
MRVFCGSDDSVFVLRSGSRIRAAPSNRSNRVSKTGSAARMFGSAAIGERKSAMATGWIAWGRTTCGE